MKTRKRINLDAATEDFQKQIAERRASRKVSEIAQPTAEQIAHATEWIKANMFGGAK